MYHNDAQFNPIMVNWSKWFAEFLFAVVHLSVTSAEPPNEISSLKSNQTIRVTTVANSSHPTPPHPVTRRTRPTISIITLKPDTPPPPVCKIEKIDMGKYLFADCSNKKLSKIPHDFGAKNYPYIKSLDLSSNPITRLNSSDLYNFTSLSELAMKNIPNLNSFPKDFFLHTQFLEKLDISGTPISDFGEISAYLHKLNATNIQAKNVNLSHLVSLEELCLKDNRQLANFPLLSLTAPLRHLDLRFCSMTNLSYINLAPFCLLKYFGLESVELEKASNASQCCFIKNWTLFYQIPGSENQKCGSGDPCSKINSTLSPSVIAVHNECLKRTGLFEFIKVLVEIFIGVVVGSGLLYFLCYNYIFKRRSTYEYYDDTDRYAYYDTNDDYDDDDDDDDYDDYDEEYQYYS